MSHVLTLLREMETFREVTEPQFDVMFFAVGKKSRGGDCILIRYHVPSERDKYILIDGGYKGDAQRIASDLPKQIDDLVCSHLDRDHIGGLIYLLSNQGIKFDRLWITWEEPSPQDIRLLIEENRRHIVEASASPNWVYVVLESFNDGAKLLAMAKERGIKVSIARQGMDIGCLHVLSPSTRLYRQLTDKISADTAPVLNRISVSGTQEARRDANVLLEATVSASNEMSTVLWTDFGGVLPGGFLFTSDAGPKGLETAVSSSEELGIRLARLGAYQVPHHGAEVNFPRYFVDKICGPVAIISAPPNSRHHPSQALMRMLQENGVVVFATKGASLRIRSAPLNQPRWRQIHGTSKFYIYREHTG